MKIKDLKIGTELKNEYGVWVITFINEDYTLFNVKGRSGEKVQNENDIQYYSKVI